MSWTTLVVPPPGRLLEVPPRHEWPALVARPHDTSARADVLERTRFFTGRPVPPRPHLLVSGHQPGFAAAGVWIKNFVLAAMADACDAIPLHVQVDSDLPPLLQAFYPTGPLTRAHAILYTPPGGRPFETLPVPSPATFDAFLKQMRDNIEPGLRPRIDRLAEAQISARRKLAEVEWPHLGLWLDFLRRELEGGLSTWEVPISHVCATPGFRRFVAQILSDLPRFFETYNQALDAYRKRHRVRTKANPMPDLRMRGTAREAPFWVLDKNKLRRGVWLEPDGTLLAREVPIGRFTGETDSLTGLALRPRALTLTLFFRLFVCDLFIHGVGGARYDTVADDIARSFFGVEPPPYACISASVPLPLELDRDAPDPRIVRRRLRDLYWNPQRFTASEEKLRLIEAIQHTPSHQRRPLAEAIAAANEQLRGRVVHLRTQWESELRDAERAAAARAIAEARDYPYFLHDPAVLQTIAGIR